MVLTTLAAIWCCYVPESYQLIACRDMSGSRLLWREKFLSPLSIPTKNARFQTPHSFSQPFVTFIGTKLLLIWMKRENCDFFFALELQYSTDGIAHILMDSVQCIVRNEKVPLPCPAVWSIRARVLSNPLLSISTEACTPDSSYMAKVAIRSPTQQYLPQSPHFFLELNFSSPGLGKATEFQLVDEVHSVKKVRPFHGYIACYTPRNMRHVFSILTLRNCLEKVSFCSSFKSTWLASRIFASVNRALDSPRIINHNFGPIIDAN
jgi:hypothetical protein